MKAVAGASMVVLIAALVLSGESINPLRLIQLFTNLALIPWVVAASIQRLFSVTLAIEGDALVMHSRARRVEIPIDAVAGAAPWIVPLPAGGFWLRLRSGRRFRFGIQTADAPGLLATLTGAGAPAGLDRAAAHPTLLYERSRNASVRRWYYPLLKFPVFALVPTLPLWRVHQFIAYGGTFGEYYQYGLRAYLLGFAVYWATLAIYLVLWAAVLRGVVEAACLCAAWVAPSREARVRRAAEVLRRVLYYGGVPALLVLRFFPW
jgi:apolipoprotein N-acyltransferase